MESILSYPTKCRLAKGDGSPCTFTLTDAPMVAQVIGEPDARIQRYITELMKHSQKKHPEAFQLAQLHGQMFFGYLTLGNFATTDPAMIQMRKKFEDQLRRYATPRAVTDEEIEEAIKAMQFTADNVRFALQHVRDYYEGRAPVPPQSPLITP